VVCDKEEQGDRRLDSGRREGRGGKHDEDWVVEERVLTRKLHKEEEGREAERGVEDTRRSTLRRPDGRNADTLMWKSAGFGRSSVLTYTKKY
jgi:hypothetical protein